MKALLAAAALLIPAPVAPANLPTVVISPKAIVQVICFGKGYISSGTAFRIGNGTLLSVNHVTSEPNCYIAGEPVSVWYASPKADFSILHGGDGPFLRVNCAGFVKGRKYLALGYARGLPEITQVELVALGKTDSGEALLTGMVPVIPGMSGGAIIDAETGEVVGTVNAENFEEGLSWSVELKGTPVCRQNVA